MPAKQSPVSEKAQRLLASNLKTKEYQIDRDSNIDYEKDSSHLECTQASIGSALDPSAGLSAQNLS